MDADLRAAVLARDGYRCRRCRQPAESIHHRLPRSRGGDDSPLNLVALCGSGTTGCHGLIEAHPEWARMEGWTVPGYLLRGLYVGISTEYREHYGDGRREMDEEAS